MKKDKAFTLSETSTRHSEGTNVPEESKTNRFFAIAQNDEMCHSDTQKKSPLWGESGCAKRSEHTTVREGNNDDSNTLSRIRKIPTVSTTTTSPRRGKSAFTLAETMIVLVILGIVAAITIPALVNRHMEAERRTKLRKAMSVYDTALNKMVIENGIKSDTALTNWADSDTKNDCANTSAYFKVARNLEVNENATNCKFRAADGVFWDISDIKKPLVALREQDLNAETAQSDTNRAFYMFGWFDENGSLRANDLGKISATDKADLQKLYDFINGKTKTSMGEVAKETCDYLCQIQKITDECPANCEENNSCTNCKISDNDFDNAKYYNSNNILIGTSYGSFIDTRDDCSDTATGKVCVSRDTCQLDGTCDIIDTYSYDKDGNVVDLTIKTQCDVKDDSNCWTIIHGNHYGGDLSVYCDGNDKNCVQGMVMNDINISDYGFSSLPFSKLTFDNLFIETNGDSNNYTAYLDSNISMYSPMKTNMIDKGEYNNLIQVENGQPVKAGEFNPENGTTWEADVKTGKVTFYTNCEGYKHNCTGPSQTKDISEVMEQ